VSGIRRRVGPEIAEMNICHSSHNLGDIEGETDHESKTLEQRTYSDSKWLKKYFVCEEGGPPGLRDWDIRSREVGRRSGLPLSIPLHLRDASVPITFSLTHNAVELVEIHPPLHISV
jgi:hypothetical protein